MIGLGALLKRNIKLFFKDKGMFFTSLITPMILLLLYSTFLANVYRDAFASSIPTGVPIDDKLLDGAVGGQLLSSLLAVCCVTVSFCSNFLMVQDKVTGARGDLTMAPVRRSTLALGYYLASAAATLIICYAAAGASFLYLANVGWYLSGSDVAKILLDVFLLVMFGTALSSVINHFLCTQGQISAVGSIVSADMALSAARIFRSLSLVRHCRRSFPSCRERMRRHCFGITRCAACSRRWRRAVYLQPRWRVCALRSTVRSVSSTKPSPNLRCMRSLS